MELFIKKRKRKFTISNERLEYLIKLLSFDDLYNHHLNLLNSKKLEPFHCISISSKIRDVVEKHSIFECIDKTNNQIIPVVDPYSYDINLNNFTLHPVSNESRRFLMQLSDFLNSDYPILIN